MSLELFKYLILDCTFPYLPAAFAINRTAFNDFKETSFDAAGIFFMVKNIPKNKARPIKKIAP